MTDPTFDDDGYPTDETLNAIKEWNYLDFAGLVEFCKKAWRWDDYFVIARVDKELVCTVSTGGWSGNESIIGALQDNVLFWVTCWEQSRRGGHYIFTVKVI